MITDAVSSAARLSLAPARLVSRLAGSLLGDRGNGSETSSSSRQSDRSSAASRRGKNQSKRATTGARSKAAPARPATKRAAARPSGKTQRAAARTRTRAERGQARGRAKAKRQPAGSGAARAERPDDAAIARKVESTIFRDLDVGGHDIDVQVVEGVVRLRGEVATPHLLSVLEVRAKEVNEVSRVENFLRVEQPRPDGDEAASTRIGAGAPAPEAVDTPPRPQEVTTAVGDDSETGPRAASGSASAAGEAVDTVSRMSGQQTGSSGPHTPADVASAAAARRGDDAVDPDQPAAGDIEDDPAHRPRDPALRRTTD